MAAAWAFMLTCSALQYLIGLANGQKANATLGAFAIWIFEHIAVLNTKEGPETGGLMASAIAEEKMLQRRKDAVQGSGREGRLCNPPLHE
jgi:hypothetical protein